MENWSFIIEWTTAEWNEVKCILKTCHMRSKLASKQTTQSHLFDLSILCNGKVVAGKLQKVLWRWNRVFCIVSCIYVPCQFRRMSSYSAIKYGNLTYLMRQKGVNFQPTNTTSNFRRSLHPIKSTRWRDCVFFLLSFFLFNFHCFVHSKPMEYSPFATAT